MLVRDSDIDMLMICRYFKVIFLNKDSLVIHDPTKMMVLNIAKTRVAKLEQETYWERKRWHIHTPTHT